MIPWVLAPAPETPELGPGRPGLCRTQQVAGDTRILETRECCHVIKCDEKIFRGLIFSNSVSLIFSWSLDSVIQEQLSKFAKFHLPTSLLFIHFNFKYKMKV